MNGCDENMTTLEDVRYGRNLPAVSEVGSDEKDWEIPAVNSDNDLPTTLKFRGSFLGFGTTQRDQHSNHSLDFADPTLGEKCTACRWFELRIFDDVDSDCYILLYSGRSIVPSESQRFRVERVYTAYELIEAVTVKREGTPQYLSVPAVRALSQAAGFDTDIAAAYNARRSNV